MDVLSDPWADETVLSDRRPAARWEAAGRLLRPVAAWVLAVWAVVARLWDHGPDERRATLALAAIVAVIEVVRRRTPLHRWSGRLAVAVAAGVALAVTAPSVGRAPAILAVATLLVADAALCDWRPTTRHPARSVEVVALAVPLLVAAGATYHRTGAVLVPGVLLLLALAVVELAHVVPDRVRTAHLAVARATRSIARLVGACIFFAVALVTLYLPGLLSPSGPILRRVRRRGPARWRPVRTTVEEQRRDAPYPFATTPNRTRRRRLAAGLAVAAVTALAAAALTEAELPDPEPKAMVGARRLLSMRASEFPATRGSDFADELQFEESRAGRDFSGRYLNVEDGIRRTWSPGCDCPRATVWLVGGSAAFGIGQRDDHTIASELARRAEEDGLALDVVNMARPGITVWQEYALVAARLDVVERPPDLVVFYDGFNDAQASVTAAALHGLEPYLPTVMRSEDELRYIDEAPTLDAVGGRRAVVDATARKYRLVQEQAIDLLDRHGVESEWFFQPDAFAAPRQLEDFAAALGRDTASADQIAGSDIAEVVEDLADELSPEVVNLRDVYDEVDEPVFIGAVHTNELGARIVAHAIYDRLADDLRVLAG